MLRSFVPFLAVFALVAGCATESEPADETVHVQTADDIDDDQSTTQMIRCGSGKDPEPMTCCNASDGCVRKYTCWVC